MKRLAIPTVLAIAAILSACSATPPKNLNVENDWRTRTDYSPYRSVAPAIQCDDCRY